ncbi:MAG: hypothetical protein ACD_20C00243G0001 [uncultured bacterium]|nr:MAG: hypothetical protein ACD_20C00243G0001 [uncultured bacterium]
MYYDRAQKELKQFEIEFSKMYKRIMVLETVIKAKIKNSVINTHKDRSFEQFHDFFNKDKLIKDFNTPSGNPFLAILNDKDIDPIKKFSALIDRLYLRHTLQLILKVPEFRNKNVQKIFYKKIPELFGMLINSRQDLVDLRNDIAHYNFNRYSIKQKDYHKALLIYEIHLGCNLGELNHLPNDMPHKPNITKILNKIYELRPDLFDKNIPHSNYHCNKDRILVDLYEDIAVLNGWKYNELKSAWDVIRIKYRHNENNNNKIKKYIHRDIFKNSTNQQLNLKFYDAKTEQT